jgi:hypothetical protein
VRRWVKVVIWSVVFIVCAGAGAYVAAHTNPFPPGVEDPGARTSPPPTGVSSERWRLAMFSQTRHDLHVGGSCQSAWRTTGTMTIQPDGHVSGAAHARLRSWHCDFPVAQVQTRFVRMDVKGTRSGDRLFLDFRIDSSSPIGSQDLGGFTATVQDLAPQADITDGHAETGSRVSRPDGDLGRYVNASDVQLDCASGC